MYKIGVMALKAAFWGIGLIVLGLLGFVLIDLFGNITVTNQLNYTSMKNEVEASMYDALDIAHYRSGFCLCTDKSKTSGKWVFNDESEYELVDITYEDGKELCDSTKKKCEILHNEYRINKKAFSESLIRRFANVINNNKGYELIIQEVIEYPPKVSVRINSSDDNFFPTDKASGGFTIVNQMDSIVETKNGLPTPRPTPTPTPKPTPVPADEPPQTVIPEDPGDNGELVGMPECSWHHGSTNVTCKKIEYEKGECKQERQCSGTMQGTACFSTCASFPSQQACTAGPSGAWYSGQCCWGSGWRDVEVCGPDVAVLKKVGSGSVSVQGGYSTCAGAINACVSKAKGKCSGSTAYDYDCKAYQTYSYKCANGASGSFSRECGSGTTCQSYCGTSRVTSCVCQG